MQNHISVNRAAEMLERTRRTVKRALRDVPPDGFERGQPRWRLANIVKALERRTNKTSYAYQGDGEDDVLEQEHASAFAKFEKAFDAMKKLPTLERRRARSVELGNLVDDCIAKMKARDEFTNLHPDHIALRGQEVYRIMMWGFCSPCEWNKSEVWTHVAFRSEDLDGCI